MTLRHLRCTHAHKHAHMLAHACTHACTTLACHLRPSTGTADSEPRVLQRDLAYQYTLTVPLDSRCMLCTTACHNSPHFSSVLIMTRDVPTVTPQCWCVMTWGGQHLRRHWRARPAPSRRPRWQNWQVRHSQPGTSGGGVDNRGSRYLVQLDLQQVGF